MNVFPCSVSHEFKLNSHNEPFSLFFHPINSYILIVSFKWAANPLLSHFLLSFFFTPYLSFFAHNEFVLSACVQCVDRMNKFRDHRRLLCITLGYNRLSEGFGSLTWLLSGSSNYLLLFNIQICGAQLAS